MGEGRCTVLFRPQSTEADDRDQSKSSRRKVSLVSHMGKFVVQQEFAKTQKHRKHQPQRPQ